MGIFVQAQAEESFPNLLSKKGPVWPEINNLELNMFEG